MPDEPPAIYMSGFGDKAVRLAARIADGYMCVRPDPDFVRLYPRVRRRSTAGPAGQVLPRLREA